MMTKGVQLSRARGWRMPDNTVMVSRGTKWGNPYRVVKVRDGWVVDTLNGDVAESVQHFTNKTDAAAFAVQLYENHVTTVAWYAQIREELAGKNLACWCKEGDPCHRDVLLRIAATPPPQPPRVALHVWGPTHDSRMEAAETEFSIMPAWPALSQVVEHWAPTVSVKHHIVTEFDVVDAKEPVQHRWENLGVIAALVFAITIITYTIWSNT